MTYYEQHEPWEPTYNALLDSYHHMETLDFEAEMDIISMLIPDPYSRVIFQTVMQEYWEVIEEATDQAHTVVVDMIQRITK